MTRRISPWLAAAVLLACTFAPLPARAQAPAPPLPGQVDPHLTPAQIARKRVIDTKLLQERDALAANTKLTPAQKQAKFLALQKAAYTSALALLTPAQKAIVQKNQAIAVQNRQQMQAKGEAFNKAHQAEITAGQALAAKLQASLTPAQKAQISAIKQAEMVKLRQLVALQGLTPQAKQTQLQSIQQDTQGKIQAVLTPAQKADYTKLQQMQNTLTTEARASLAK